MSYEASAPKETFEPGGFGSATEQDEYHEQLSALGSVALSEPADWEDGLEPTWFCFSD